MAVSGNPQTNVFLKLSTSTFVLFKDVYQYTREILSTSNRYRKNLKTRVIFVICCFDLAIYDLFSFLWEPQNQVTISGGEAKTYFLYIVFCIFSEREGGSRVGGGQKTVKKCSTTTLRTSKKP